MKTCPHCAGPLQNEAVTCTHCGRSIGVGHGLRASGEKLRVIGCGVTLLIAIPIVVILLMAEMC